MRPFLQQSWRTVLAAMIGVGFVALTPTGSLAATPQQPTWSRLSPPTSPPDLSAASAAYDAADQSVVVFGGRLADGSLSDATWVWNGATWSAASPYGAVPPARQSAAMAYDPALGQLVLFGGSGTGGTLLGDTWVWNGASWSEVTPATSPGARAGAALAAQPDGNLLLFGGYGRSNAPAQPPPPTTTTTARPTRKAAHPGSTSSSTAAPRSGSGATSTSSSTSAPSTTSTSSTTTSTTSTTTTANPSGGSSASGAPGPLNDTWTLTTDGAGADVWKAVTVAAAPPAVAGAAMASDGTATVLFGGVPAAPGSRLHQASGTTWIWDGTAWREATSPTSPAPRTDAVAAWDADLHELILFGGHNGSGVRRDTWAFSGGRWTRLAPAYPPTSRYGALGAYDSASRQLVIFGGRDGLGRLLGETVVLTRLPPTPVHTSPSTTAPATTKPSSGQTAHNVGGSSSTSSSRSTRPGGTPGTSGSSSSSPAATGGPSGRQPATRLHRGDVVTLTGSGFLPHARVTITFHSVPAEVVATTRADGAGRFRVDVSIPVTAAMGTHHFIATGTGPHGTTTLVTPVEVVALAIAHGLSALAKASLTGIAVAIPLATWLVLEVVGRLRRRPAAAAT